MSFVFLRPLGLDFIQYLCLSSPLGPVISKLYTAVKKPLGFMVSHFRGNTRMKPPRAR